jgi:NAD(P)-dependent dehydrogenase (short-subunit alcohol dehydrogenase family)
MQLAHSVFLITGGSSGLGAATARMALDAGARVVIADLAPPRDGFATPQDGDRVAYMCTNVADEASAQAAVDTAMQSFGRLDVLVNAAGIGPAEKIHGKNGPHRLESFTRTVQVNLIGTFNMMRLAVAAMAASGVPGTSEHGGQHGAQHEAHAQDSLGVIINTASVAAFDGQIGQAAYAASKGGVVAMTLPAARELARERVRVMTIAPGIFETPMLLGLAPEVQDSLGRSVPHPARLGRPTEYAALVRSIVENDYLNGEVIRIDGGIRMAAK